MKTKNSKILLACSYGPDSMALFDMLLKQVGNNGFEVAHVNYRLREESDDETQIKVALNLIKIITEHHISSTEYESVEDMKYDIKTILSEIYSEKVEDLEDSRIEFLFRKIMRREIQDIERDVEHFS